MGSFSGKVALITGAGSGIGRATAQRFAAEGASVVVVDFDETSGKQTADEIDGSLVVADVGRVEDMERAITHAEERFGGLDIVYLNAGIASGEADIRRMTTEQYRRMIETNVDGIFFGARAALPALARRGGGAIVATASLAGLIAYPDDPVYALTKHAVVGLVRGLAASLADHNITINCVCPGFVDTPILGPYVESFRAAGFPLLRTEEVASAVMEVANSSQSGQVFVLQPGRAPEAYRFRGVPGPRIEGASGALPPTRTAARARGEV